MSDEGRLHLAVSTTSNPLDSWTIYTLIIAGDLPDYPGIGLTDDKVTVSYNRFDIDTALYTGAQTVVFQKSDLLAGLAVGVAATAPDLSHFTVRPAHSLSATTTQNMASVDAGSATSLHLWKITGTPDAANLSLIHVAHPAIGSLVSPCPSAGLACAEQSGTSALVDSGDNRILEAIWRNGSMWVSANGACSWSGETAIRSCMKLIEVDTSTNSILQDGLFGNSGTYFYYPAIRTDLTGNLHVVYSRSSAFEFVQTRVASRDAGDPVNSLSSDVQLKAGEIAYLPGFSSSPYRWGDYLGSAVDPSDPSTVWVIGQYAKNDLFERWGTW
ncbi:MAG: hypothetical protein IIC86_03730, partial [Chloroflexi bacterium]|nr:hypothetical protein [Chloroflexota bacterium]